MGKLKQVIEHYGHELDSSNKLCCPFHNENTPSNTYYEDTDSSYCYGCSAGGNAINWICNEEGWDSNSKDFRKAVKKYEEITGDVETYALPKTIEELEQERIKMALPFNKEVLAELKAKCTFDSGGYRGIRSDVSKQFGVMFTKNTDGELHEVYYPTSKDSVGGKLNLTGFKVRQLPKTFNKHYGETGGGVELFGQWKASSNDSDTLIVCAGENDALAAQQMLNDNTAKYNTSKNTNFKASPCVSGTVGENGLAKQLRANYDFLDTFKKIIYIRDMDSVGLSTVEAVFEAIPRGKLFLMELSEKDPHDMLIKGKQSEFISAYFKAKPYMPDGVKSSIEGFLEVEDELLKPRVTLPDFMYVMQDMLGGGIQQGRIVNIIAATSCGKSTYANRMVYHWIFNSPITPTIISLEATAAQYNIDLLQTHLGMNFTFGKTGQEIVDFLEQEWVKEKIKELCYKEDGSARYYIVDERSGDITNIEKQMELMFRKHGSKLFLVDVLTDMLRGLNTDKSEAHMNFQKILVKEGATIVNVHHTTKIPLGQDGKVRDVTEYDCFGTSSFVQSGAVNIVLNRDKISKCEIEKNTTRVSLPKARGGKTGDASGWFFDFSTSTCYDVNDSFVQKRKAEISKPQESF